MAEGRRLAGRGICHGRDGERDFMGFIYGVCLRICLSIYVVVYDLMRFWVEVRCYGTLDGVIELLILCDVIGSIMGEASYFCGKRTIFWIFFVGRYRTNQDMTPRIHHEPQVMRQKHHHQMQMTGCVTLWL